MSDAEPNFIFFFKLFAYSYAKFVLFFPCLLFYFLNLLNYLYPCLRKF